MQNAFDEQALLEHVDDDIEFLEETIEMLDEDSPALLSKITVAAMARDAEELVKPAHALKGMLSNFCAQPAVDAARELEIMGREERLADVDAAVERVQIETERLKEALHLFLRTKTT